MVNHAIERYLTRPGPFTDEGYGENGAQADTYHKAKVLVIGAGGLGCEILKDLALSGFKDIHVIDMDTIDVSNLNRQFLFRESDVGKPKATCAADFIMKRVKGCTVTPYYGKIQDKDEEYYMQFHLVICGLDSVEARRWINAMLVDMVDMSNPESLKPLIDGGTEGFKGQARVILPTISSCYECTLDMLTQQTTFPICTIANTPRVPEHCIEYASILEWPKQFDRKIDTDSPEDITWLYETALNRANEFNITGVTYQLTQGLVKNIIPAIASTNAIISAACVNEATKIVTDCNPYLNNYMMYTGEEAVYTYTFEHEKKQGCPVCGSNVATPLRVGSRDSLQDVMDKLQVKPEINSKSPSLSTSDKKLYLRAPPQLEELTRPNLDKRIDELIQSGDEVVVTDPGLPFSLRLKIIFC